MYSRQFISLEEARTVGEAAIAKASENPDRPVVVAVVDTMGDLVYLVRQDNTTPGMVAMATNKAYTAVRFRMDTLDFAKHLKEVGLSITDFVDPRCTVVEEGICLRAPDGTVIGAIGASGRVPTIDKVTDKDLAQAGADTLKRT